VKRLAMLAALCAVTFTHGARAQAPSARSPWIPDRGDGTYVNPVIYADYSDPDVIRVGDDYYMVSSSMNTVPGLPILHSRDLVNWRLVAHALPRLVPEDVYASVQPGKGVWAPAIRHHDGKFWIYYPDPDFGIYVVTATHPAGPWSTPVLVKAGKGRIDPCPFWDDTGKVYLIHGWARSRAGFANVLTLLRLSPDGFSALDDGSVVIDGDKLPGYRTLEGPKLYKRDGVYWVFAPAGGVKPGWQSVFRSRTIDGPYEDRIVLAQGATDINGPHQGAWVTTSAGEDWFLHFQDVDAYGRVVHLQPMTWRSDGWPVMGTDRDGDGRGEPVRAWTKPIGHAVVPAIEPATSDEFSGSALGLQWQWQANPSDAWLSFAATRGALRLVAQPSPHADNLWLVPNLLLQKLPAPSFTATTVLRFAPASDGERAGLVVFGQDYAWIGLQRVHGQIRLVVRSIKGAKRNAPEDGVIDEAAPAGPVYLRVTMAPGGVYRFSAGSDPRTLTPRAGEFTARAGDWVVAKVGLFAVSQPGTTRAGSADWDWFRVEPPVAASAR
jgi:beta-xylosidase